MSGKILIIDDLATNRIVLKVKLASAWYLPLMAGDAESCLQMARDELPDLILLNDNLADQQAIPVLERLRADPQTTQIPVIYLATSADPALRMQALQAGADDFMAKPYDDQMLMARLRNLVRSVQDQGRSLSEAGLAEDAADFQQPGVIALVADTPERALALRRGLAPFLNAELVILSQEEALTERGQGAAAPDVAVIEADCGAPNGGFHMLSELRSRAQTRHAAICVICRGSSPEGAAMAYDLGANQVVPADVQVQELALRLTKLLRRKRHADRMRASLQDSMRAAVTDELTGLWNRRYALSHLPGIVAQSHAAGLAYSVLVIDLDRFKTVNDRFGHAIGDKVLTEVAQRLGTHLREGDLLARMGGEEFLVGLPDTDAEQGRMIAERLCRVVEARPCAPSPHIELPITISIGLASGLPGLAEPELISDVIHRADLALLQAKRTGRNKVTSAQSAA